LKLFAAAAMTGAWPLVSGTVLLFLIYGAPNGLLAWVRKFDRKNSDVQK
jgi:hypothetical protein